MAEMPAISDAEWQVMNVVWDRQPVMAHEIIQSLASSNDWSPATIRTFLHRLVKKGALSHVVDGNRYVYQAAHPRTTLVKRASKSFLESVFAGDTLPLIAHFVKSQRLSPEAIRQLRDLLNNKESS